MRTKTAGNLFILGAALWACAAMAAGLGALTVRSTLGQPLVADIEVTAKDRRELEGLSARIASVEAHRLANIPYTASAIGLKATLQTGRDGRRIIRVESVQPVAEPTVKLLIELSSAGTQTLRAYDALLEPPEIRRR